ncbi:MAG TPA: matrixin family metalloprotease, partial [Myxococcaceae bacterium]|nr:matrixin family metalloprotease [Myxococcaceae bacterium]
MRIADRSLRLCAVLAVLGLASVARAGGPLIVDPTSGKPFAYPVGRAVPVYHDLGDFAVVIDWVNYPATVTFDNAVGAGQVRTGFREWSSVPTSSFRAEVKGDFSALGLPDITGANANLIIGAWNGGGDHVIFDADGSVMTDFFGVGPNVLGISTPEFGDGETGTILESWTVLNGQGISADDANAAHFQGVTTHELGHAIGLAHTQTNGASFVYKPFTGEPLGPQSCATLPYRTDLSPRDVETMYPFTDPSPFSDVGLGMGHVHTADDRAILSDLYPGRGWPWAHGTISGKVLDVDGKTPLTGVNVVARNIDDPFVDASSSITGEWTQGQFGPDGSFVLHGLKPGGRYVVYVDALVAGGYSTPPLWFLPGAERFYAGREHGHDRDDDETRRFDPCEYQVIRPRAGKAFTADIAFER